jgi:predicted nucleic acid-binding protein
MWSSYANRTIYPDANVIIYAIEKSHSWSRSTKALLEAIDRRTPSAVTSELAVAEVLAKPLALRNQDLIEKYERLFAGDSDLRMVAIDREVLLRAARLQGTAGLKLFDSIHVATAQLSGCDFFLTEDERLGRILTDRPAWLKLSGIE